MTIRICGRSTDDADAVHAIKVAGVALGRFRLDEVIEALATVLLHALKAETHVYRKSLLKLGMGFKHIDPAKNRALVIG